MQVQTVVNLISVKPGKNKNWLIFEAYVGAMDRNKKYTLEFCGTELKHSLSLLDQEIEQLKVMMCSDFGYAPFDLEEAKKILKNSKSYVLIHGKAES